MKELRLIKFRSAGVLLIISLEGGCLLVNLVVADGICAGLLSGFRLNGFGVAGVDVGRREERELPEFLLRFTAPIFSTRVLTPIGIVLKFYDAILERCE